MNARPLALVLLLGVLCGNAFANDGVTISIYKANRQEDKLATYVAGLGRGFQMANSVLLAEKKPLIYCAGDRVLDQKIFLSIIDQEILAPAPGINYDVKTPIEVVLAHGMRRRYPC